MAVKWNLFSVFSFPKVTMPCNEPMHVFVRWKTRAWLNSDHNKTTAKRLNAQTIRRAINSLVSLILLRRNVIKKAWRPIQVLQCNIRAANVTYLFLRFQRKQNYAFCLCVNARTHTHDAPFDTLENEKTENEAKIYLVERPEIKSQSEFIQERDLNITIDGTGFIYYYYH